MIALLCGMIMTATTIRQEFDVGDLVKLVGPIGAAGEMGIITKRKRIVDMPKDGNCYHWHKDEYRCLVKLTTGECEWIRAKFLKIVSKVKF